METRRLHSRIALEIASIGTRDIPDRQATGSRIQTTPGFPESAKHACWDINGLRCPSAGEASLGSEG